MLQPMVRYNRPEDVHRFDEKLADATRDQQSAADDIDEHPTWAFSEHEEEGDHSASHYRNVYYRFFGPEDDKYRRTFGEIKDKYGTVKSYYERRYKLDSGQQQTLTDVNASDLVEGNVNLSEEMREVLEMGIEIGFEQGWDRGHDRGYEKAKEELEQGE